MPPTSSSSSFLQLLQPLISSKELLQLISPELIPPVNSFNYFLQLIHPINSSKQFPQFCLLHLLFAILCFPKLPQLISQNWFPHLVFFQSMPSFAPSNHIFQKLPHSFTPFHPSSHNYLFPIVVSIGFLQVILPINSST